MAQKFCQRESNENMIAQSTRCQYPLIYVLTCNFSRPGVWALEKSDDNGKTWKPWQYFAGNDVECQKYFGIHALRRGERIERDDQVICSTEFSKGQLISE